MTAVHAGPATAGRGRLPARPLDPASSRRSRVGALRRALRRASGSALLVVALATSVLSGCSGGDTGDPGADPSPTPGASTPPVVPEPAPTVRPVGPAADLSQELTGGRGVFLASGVGRQTSRGIVEQEYVAAGRAVAYRPVGELAADGRWTFRAAEHARYRTRVVVRRPAAAADASGIVLVEWLNVSGGLDADPGYRTTSEEITRQGHTWVGVSVQRIGVEGGPVAVSVDVPGAAAVVGKGLRKIDPARYGSLHHPGDAFGFDMLTQVARAVRAGGPVTSGVVPEQVIAMGESQSAFGLVTYVNGVQPLTHAFDGFFVQSRGAAPLALPELDQAADIATSLFGTPTIFRTDTDVPVFDLQTETDVVGILNSAAARQPDTDLLRTWEVAGTAHADLHLLGPVTASAVDCGGPVNDGPLHVVAKAALRHLVTWVGGGDLPPVGDPLLTSPGSPDGLARDRDGIALGGVRTPPVDVAVRVLSGAPGRDDSVLCLLFGSTRPLPERRLQELRRSRPDYLRQYRQAADAVVAAGYALPEDRADLMGYAHPELVRP